MHYIWLADKPQSSKWNEVSRNFIKVKIKRGVRRRGKHTQGENYTTAVATATNEACIG